MSAASQHRHSSRRAFMRHGALVLGTVMTGRSLLAAEGDAKALVRVGLVTDIHYADRDHRGSRYYRESLDKVSEAVAKFNENPPDFVAALGDLIDSGADLDSEASHLKAADAALAKLKCERRYVLGNHCVSRLTKAEFFEHTPMDAGHYAFEKGGLRFVVIDSCYRADGEAYGRHNFDWKDANVPDGQLQWLDGQLKRGGPTVVLAHQRLDEAGSHGVRNAAAVRAVLEKHGNVLGVFQGHSHRNDHQQINGIHYCVQRAVVEGSGAANNGYGVLSVYADGSLRVEGYRDQKDHRLARGG